MARIRSKNTKPELAIRSLLHRMGLRFRLHKRDLPGCPDIVLPKYKSIILVHGCFWHYHKKCVSGKIPKTNSRNWKKKLERNVLRDKKNALILKKMGWKILIIWECEISKDLKKAQNKIIKFLKL